MVPKNLGSSQDYSSRTAIGPREWGRLWARVRDPAKRSGQHRARNKVFLCRSVIYVTNMSPQQQGKAWYLVSLWLEPLDFFPLHFLNGSEKVAELEPTVGTKGTPDRSGEMRNVSNVNDRSGALCTVQSCPGVLLAWRRSSLYRTQCLQLEALEDLKIILLPVKP